MLKETLAIWAFSLVKIPMMFYVRPRVIRLDEDVAVIRIPISRRTRNHLSSMYFGALAVGADAVGGIMAMQAIRKSGQPISLVFRDFKAEFHKRPEADVHFTCTEGSAIRALVDRVIASKERETIPVTIIATTPSISGDEPVATFELGLSLKVKGKATAVQPVAAGG